MPVGWLTMGTPEYLQELIKQDPDGYEAEVDRLVAEAGGVLFKIYWDQGCSQTQVIVGVPEGADQVYEKLERTFQTSVKRLWNLQERKRHPPFEAS